jgi:hypothetical protein
LLELPAGAATYYIDNNAANDAANGTSTATPWKRCPGMTGFAGSYSHSAGDVFIFKGGVTWTSLGINITAGGTAGNHDVYTSDPAWYAGGSWTRPIFSGNNSQRTLVAMNATYVTINNIEMKETFHTVSGTPYSYGGGTISIWGGGNNLTFSNLYIHGWDQTRAGAGTDGQGCGGILNFAPSYGMTNYLITNCDIGNPEHGDVGTCLYFPGEVAFSKIHDCPEGILHGGYSVHDNEFYNLGSSYDPAQHNNVIYSDHPNGYVGGTYISRIYNNWIHTGSNPEPIYPNGSQPSGGGTTIWYIYNNYVDVNNAKGQR